MSTSFKSLLCLFALICLSASHYDGHQCDHDKQQQENPPEFIDIEEDFSSQGRILASYPHIRIYAHYDELSNSAPSSLTSYVRNDLAPPVIAWFEGALRVKYPVAGGKLKLGSSVSSLCGMKVPSVLRSGVSADYVILFDSRSESSSVVATSKYCSLTSGSNRPVVATTNFNRQMFVAAKGDVILHEKNTYLLLHEMMHTFGFSSSVYKYWVSSSGRTLSGHVKSMSIAGKKHTVINVPSLTNKLRDYHGCSSVPGAILEDDGGSGTDASHFEKKFYLYENMATGSHSGKRVSSLSLALLEATGWYDVDYSYAEPYFYGEGQGCSFINGKCSSNSASFEEFCTGSNRGCGFMGHSGGRCSSDEKTEGCKYVIPNNDYHCENEDAEDDARFPSLEVYGRGAGSKCFSGDLNSRQSSNGATSFCFKYNCVGSGSGTQLQVLLGSNTVNCKREGKVSVDGYYGSINCPDPVSFCSTVGKRYCPRNCMGRGNCVNNKCQCDRGFTGVDCAMRD